MNLFYTRPDRSLHLGVFPKPECIDVHIPGAPAFMRGLKLLFISDVHLRRCVDDARLDALIGQIAQIHADLILLGGDYAEKSDQCRRFFHAFKGVSCPLGCFAVPGNNDASSGADLRQVMAGAGVTLLKNEDIRLDLPGGQLMIGGCDDHRSGDPRTAQLFAGEGGYRILISHFPVLPDCKCDLMLSGHTHAGQCNLLGVTPYSVGFERRYRLLGVRGLHRIGGMQLLIGNGVGVSRFPFRLGAAPQIYRIDFS